MLTHSVGENVAQLTGDSDSEGDVEGEIDTLPEATPLTLELTDSKEEG